jgi:dTDP-4-dehydrorhamnose reductase
MKEKKKLTVVILGSEGLLGGTLKRNFSRKSKYQVAEFSLGLEGERQLDITKPRKLKAKLKKAQPDWVINCVAYTDVEGCEESKGYELAKQVNGEAVKKMAKICQELGTNLVHISSDHVFNANSPKGYQEDFAQFNPMNKYGETKFLGEQGIIEQAGGLEGSDFKLQDPKFYIIRTQWLFGAGAQNFIATITRLGQERGALKVVENEVGCPTYTKDLVQGIEYLIKQQPRAGIYHLSSRNSCSRFEFAKKILKLQGIKAQVTPCKMKDFPRKANIANYSILKNTKLPKQRKWEEMLEDFYNTN